METIELEDLGNQVRQVLGELMEVAHLKPGQILMVGCPSSEIDSFKIGSCSSAEIGVAMYMALHQELESKGIYLVAQYCGYLNRALILEVEVAQAYGYESVNVVFQLKAGGSFITAAYATLGHPIAAEHIGAYAGVDIDDTLIGMYMEDAAVPVRIKAKEIGSAYVICVRTGPKFIGDVRARCDEENI